MKVVAKSLEGGSKRTLNDALRQVMSTDNRRAVVTIGTWAKNKVATTCESKNKSGTLPAYTKGRRR